MGEPWTVLLNDIDLALGRLRKALKHKDSELSLFTQLNVCVAGGGSLHDIGRITIKGCQEITGADSGSLLLVKPETETLRVVYSTTPENEGFEVRIEESLSGLAIRESGPIRLGNAPGHPKYQAAHGASKSSVLLVAVRHAGTAKLVLHLEHAQPNRFNEHDERSLQRLASALEVYANLAEVNSIQSELQDIGGMLATGDPELGLNQFLSFALANILPKHRERVSEILIYDEREGKLHLRASTVPERVGLFVPIDSGVTGSAFRTGRPVRYEALRTAETAPSFDSRSHLRAPEGPQDLDHELAVPITVGAKSIGVLNFESADPIEWNDRVAAFVDALSRQARLILSLIRQADRIRADDAADLATRMMARIGELTSDHIHKLGNTLGLINIALQDLRKEASSSPDWRGLVASLDEISGLIQEAIDLPERFKRDVADISLIEEYHVADVVEDVLAFATVPSHVKVHVMIPREMPRVRLYAEFPEVIRNLVSNAVKAMRDDERGYLDIAAHIVPAFDDELHSFRLTIRDTGPGFDDEMLAKLFTLGATTKMGDRGFGIGLWSVKVFVDRCRGSIVAENMEPRGARITMTLPVHIDLDHPGPREPDNPIGSIDEEPREAVRE